MPAEPRTRRELDALPCSCCGGPPHAGSPMDLDSRCHNGAPTRARYAEGVLEIRCAVCDKLVTRIAVAEGVLDG